MTRDFSFHPAPRSFIWKGLNPGLDLHWLLQSPWFKLSWIAWTWMQDNDLVYLSNLSESELYFIVQLHKSSELIFLEHYNGSYEGQFIFPCLRSSLHQTMKCSGHSWARIKMTHDREFILSGFYFILFYLISLTTQSYPSDCLSVCQSTSFMIFPTSTTFQTFFPNKTCSPSLNYLQGLNLKKEKARYRFRSAACWQLPPLIVRPWFTIIPLCVVWDITRQASL